MATAASSAASTSARSASSWPPTLLSVSPASRSSSVSPQHSTGLRPVLCCGETLDEREAGETESKVGGQLDADLAEVDAAELAAVAIAYEPIWAIGTGKTATPEMAQETVGFVRRRVRERFGDAADGVRILYGGSVKAANIDVLMSQPDTDGVLV